MSVLWDLLNGDGDNFDERSVCEYVHENPTSCCLENDHLESPLHILCRRRPSITVVRLVHDANPYACMRQDKYHWLPLHNACNHRASLEVIQFLVEIYPQGTQMTTFGGWLPLHIACCNKVPLQVIQMLTCQCQDSVMKKTNDGRRPLLLAKTFQAPTEVIHHLECLSDELAESSRTAAKLKSRHLFVQTHTEDVSSDVLMPHANTLSALTSLDGNQLNRMKQFQGKRREYTTGQSLEDGTHSLKKLKM